MTGAGGPAAQRAGEAMFVDADRPVTLRAMAAETAVYLHFRLVRAAELDASVQAPPAAVTEPYRTAAPIGEQDPDTSRWAVP